MDFINMKNEDTKEIAYSWILLELNSIEEENM